MGETVFNIILDYAIEHEYDFERLCREFSALPKLKPYTNFFKEIARNEIIHARELENLRFTNANIKLPQKLIKDCENTISQAKVQAKDFANFRELVSFCIQQLEFCSKLYSQIAKQIEDEPISRLFRGLANKEKKQQLLFESML